MSSSSTTEHETASDDTCVVPVTFCELCERIDLAANIDSLKKLEQYSPRSDAAGWVLGTWSDISRRQTGCRLCALVHFLVTNRIHEHGTDVEAGFEVSLEWTNSHFVKGQVIIVVVRTGDERWITLNDAFEPTEMIPTSNIKEECFPPTRPSVDIKHQLELRHIQEKLRDCDAHHGRHCQRNADRAEVVPIFLIDTHNFCLVRSDTTSPYFSLSYRWGQTENAGLSRDNLDALMCPGGLHEIWPKISRVVREAIHLVSQFDVYPQRYLWVDSLCILQDDAEHKHSQIRHMGTIYHQAAMTIVALSAHDAASALLAAQDEASETQITLDEFERQKGVRLVPDYRITTRLTLHADRPDYTYRSRGWTFQEEKLSRRVLYCTDLGLLFRCRVLLGNRPWWDDDWRNEFATAESLKTEAIRQWNSLVVDYTKRNFTYPADMLRGFAGIADSLNHPVNGETPLHIVCGVCLEWFPYSLYWKPWDVKAQRRHVPFPTWSWASCVGAVDFPMASDVYSVHRSAAELVGSPILVEFQDDTAPVKSEGSSFDSQRSSIRKHARAAIASDTRPKHGTQFPSTRPMVIGVDKFYMLKFKVQIKILKWSDLHLTVSSDIQPSQFDNPLWKHGIDRPGCYSFYEKKYHIGYTDVAPKVFETSKKGAISFIPLFEDKHASNRVVFLVAYRVGEDLYERLGTGWGCYLNAWPGKHNRKKTIYLI